MTYSGKKICILPRNLGLGGPASFQSRLVEVLTARGITVTLNADEAGVSAILVIGGTKDIAALWRAKQRGVRIVQRLNGMNWLHRLKFTGARHFLKAETGNLLLSTIRRMADGIVYQSEFSRGWWNRVHGEAKVPNRVVYNGVDLQVFSPKGAKLPADHYRLLLVEGHHGGGYEQGLFTAMKLTAMLSQRLEKKIELVVVGDVPAGLKKKADSFGQPVVWRGVVVREEIPVIDRSAHILFSSDINAACPNSAIEAMACGLPVIGYDTGSLPELLKDNAGVVAPYGGDPWKLDEPNVDALATAAQLVIKRRSEYSAAARKRAEALFDIHKVSDDYLEVLLG